jgi:hypothetical protein
VVQFICKDEPFAEKALQAADGKGPTQETMYPFLESKACALLPAALRLYRLIVVRRLSEAHGLGRVIGFEAEGHTYYALMPVEGLEAEDKGV